MEQVDKCSCPKCAEREQLEKEQEEMHFAILVAMVPLMVMTVFTQMGLL
jgi:hypothetical protein